jgi:hypothetical protein
MAIVLDGTTGITTPDIDSTQSTLGPLTQALNLGSTGQIQFPATQNASSNANTLDDYEEGTWTVGLFDAVSGGNQSPTTATGLYTKVGRVVYAQAYVANISTAGMTGVNTLYFSLPFQVDGVFRFPGAVMTDSITFASGRTYAQAETADDLVRGFIRTSGSNVSDDRVSPQDLVSGVADFWFSLTYFTD